MRIEIAIEEREYPRREIQNEFLLRIDIDLSTKFDCSSGRGTVFFLFGVVFFFLVVLVTDD